MKIILVLGALVAIAVAAPSGQKTTPVPILQYDHKTDDWQQFSLAFETGDGLTMTRQGSIKHLDAQGDEEAHDVFVQSGSHAYTAPNGERITLTWTADENGYLAQGDHLPVPPAQ